MGFKRTTERSEQTYELALTYDNVLSMVNDPDNDLGAANDQVFQLVLRKANGSESVLKEMTPTDTLVFRFNIITNTQVDTPFNDVDIE